MMAIYNLGEGILTYKLQMQMKGVLTMLDYNP